MNFGYLKLLTRDQFLTVVEGTGLLHRIQEIKLDDEFLQRNSWSIKFRNRIFAACHWFEDLNTFRFVAVRHSTQGLGVDRVRAFRRLGTVFDWPLHGHRSFNVSKTARTYTALGFHLSELNHPMHIVTVLFLMALVDPSMFHDEFHDIEMCSVVPIQPKTYSPEELKELLDDSSKG